MRRLALLLLLLAMGALAWRLLVSGPDDDGNDAMSRRAGASSPRAVDVETGDPTLVGRASDDMPPAERATADERAAGPTVRYRVVAGDEETPIEGARVELYDPEHAVLASGTTDAQGAVALVPTQGVEFYTVAAVAEGYGRLRAVSMHRWRPTKVQTLRLPLAVVFRGRVVDADAGAPITGASVSWRCAEPASIGNDGRWWLQEEAGRVVTGPDGSFCFEHGAREVDGAEHAFVVEAAGYAHVEKVVFDVDRLLDGNFAIVLPRAGRITGCVRGPDGAPLVSATVRAASEDHAWLRRERSDVRLPGTPGLDGPFADAPDPVVDLWRASCVATAEGGCFGLLDLVAGETYVVEARTTDGRDAVRETAVASEAGTEIALRIVEPGTVVVTLRSPDGRALEGREIRLTRHPSRERLDVEWERFALRTDAEGAVTFERVVPGVLRVLGPGWGAAPVVRVLESGGTERIDLVVEAAAEEPEPEPESEATVSISGRVVDDVGDPVNGVSLHARWGHGWEVSAEDGSFRLDDVPLGPGQLQILLLNSGFRLVAGEHFEFVAPAEGLEIVLQRPATVRGTLVLPPGARPPTGCTLECAGDNWSSHGSIAWAQGMRSVEFESTCV